MAEMHIKFPLDTNQTYRQILEIVVIGEVDQSSYLNQMTPNATRALAHVLLTTADAVDALAQVEASIKRKAQQKTEDVVLEPAWLPAPEVPALPASDLDETAARG